MRTETSILNSEAGMTWLRQFALHDQKLAADLIEVFCFVSRDEFASGLRERVLNEANRVNGPIAL